MSRRKKTHEEKKHKMWGAFSSQYGETGTKSFLTQTRQLPSHGSGLFGAGKANGSLIAYFLFVRVPES
jgi:hypothetical protein